jgi:predicted MFS family arabinose efflux permease
LLPVFARDLLQVGAPGQGLLLTAMGIGGFISAGLLANSGHRLPRGLMMLASGVLYGAAVALFSVSAWFGLALVAMGLAGLFHVNSNGLVQTVVQYYSPQEFRGRTMAIFSMHQAVVTLGAMVFGIAAALAGPRPAVVAMALTGSLMMLALHFAMPNARHIR